MTSKSSLGVVSVLTVLLTSGTACADDEDFQTATLGLVISAPLAGRLDQVGIGLQASLMHYPDGRYLGVGGFLQAQMLVGGGWRVAVGAQPVAYAFGAEVGLAVLSSRGGPVELALHAGPYFSIGYITFAARFTPSLTARGYGWDLTVAGNLWFEATGGTIVLYDTVRASARLGL